MAERRSRQEYGALGITRGDGDKARITSRCPLLAAAMRSGDLSVELAVLRFHPASRCRYERSAA